MGFWFGWTSIAGWLALMTTEGFFAGKHHIHERYTPLLMLYRSIFATCCCGGTEWCLRDGAVENVYSLCSHSTFATLSNIFSNKTLGSWNNGASVFTIFLRLTYSYVNILLSGLASSCSHSAQQKKNCRPYQRIVPNFFSRISATKMDGATGSLRS